ncbi:ATP synthase F0 subunit 8 (mitochondrion) [Limulus polyphemus]|uniref:ATP synthase protein 8 n=2 Tax=Limulus polyphemus TaxID=6850 RepID=ATP8_LIMPO|nr:ATP synthase F0 subunit 8 [Limulus polyphemus]Q9MLQ5.1 RecName: Full=ATP synthase protein 8; AltName: Full=A6L; AltName: Full=F-ATPase subunit 8 [Limulus polyphemus]AAF72111.1 ATP synthase F0 subunit 8 [Limulus polyphemus]AFY64345.1 ATP synthase F0 subunit 8 [Limulus polyphemus]
MPQMAPLNWAMMTIMFSLSLLVSMIILYSNFNSTPPTKMKMKTSQKLIWKW